MIPHGLRTACANCAAVNFAAGKIGAESALTLDPVAIPAVRLGPGPQLDRLRMIAALRSRKIVARLQAR